ncbi:MAG TPA: phosphopantetheine-binding protein [Bryobacteraceae bacterium]|jgi:acyl carrier protein|nr:phosphopantetheine-binding protein [Bryobacteraceae bacterium]
MNDIKKDIRAKVIELAAQLGNNAKSLRDEQEIPATGWLDSAALMELIVWFESNYDLSIDQSEVTLENFGTVNAMAAFYERAKGHATKEGI